MSSTRPKLVLATATKHYDNKKYRYMYKHLEVENGPVDYSKFRTTVWHFKIMTKPIKLSLHETTPQDVRDKVFNVMETILRDALETCLKDGSSEEDYVHMLLDFDGLDFRFNFCPAGKASVTVKDILSGETLNKVVTQFAQKIQSGKDVTINSNSKVLVYTYHKPSGGTKRVHAMDKQLFLKNCRGIVRVINPEDTMCMAKSILLAMKLPNMNRKEMHTYIQRKQRYVTKDAEALHEATGITPLRFCSFEEATVFANHLNINLHIMDMSSFKWEFIYHTHKGTDERPHVFILYLDRHYDAITDVLKVLRAFSRNPCTTLCYQCYQTFDRNHTHYCGQDPKPKKKYEVGGSY